MSNYLIIRLIVQQVHGGWGWRRRRPRRRGRRRRRRRRRWSWRRRRGVGGDGVGGLAARGLSARPNSRRRRRGGPPPAAPTRGIEPRTPTAGCCRGLDHHRGRSAQPLCQAAPSHGQPGQATAERAAHRRRPNGGVRPEAHTFDSRVMALKLPTSGTAPTLVQPESRAALLTCLGRQMGHGRAPPGSR